MNSKQLMVVALVGVMGISSLMAAEQEVNEPRGRERREQRGDRKQKRPNEKQKRKIMHYLNANYPAEMQAIRKLMKSDPEAAKAKLKALAEKGLDKMKAERKEIFELIKKYRETQDEAVLDKIRAKISANYDKRIEYAEKVIDQIAGKLDKAKDRLAELKSGREKNIDKIIERVKSGKGKERGRDAGRKL
ncbi:MAG: hypothetical protein L3J71_05775 [Victivallaceae bacterium]|nr:hypothetical protein [Victivallaceae bacterium]